MDWYRGVRSEWMLRLGRSAFDLVRELRRGAGIGIATERSRSGLPQQAAKCPLDRLGRFECQAGLLWPRHFQVTALGRSGATGCFV